MKAQLCSCPDRELRAKQQGDAPRALWWRENTGAFVLLTVWQGRLVLEEKAYDYLKYRHFPFIGWLWSLEVQLLSDHHATISSPLLTHLRHSSPAQVGKTGASHPPHRPGAPRPGTSEGRQSWKAFYSHLFLCPGPSPSAFSRPRLGLEVLQEGGPLPGPETGLLSNTRKWIVRGDTCADKARDFIGKGCPGGEK